MGEQKERKLLKIKELSILSDITHKWVNLLLPFLNDYFAKFSVSELSRKSKVPQQTASRILSKLVKLNMICYVMEGKSKLFYLDFDKQITKIMLNIIESQKALRFLLKRKEITVINELSEYCDSLILFGSYANGKFNQNSDLDIIILGKCDKEKIKQLKQKQIIQINEQYISYNDFLKAVKLKNPLAIELFQNHILFGDILKIIEIFIKNE